MRNCLVSTSSLLVLAPEPLEMELDPLLMELIPELVSTVRVRKARKMVGDGET